VLARTIARRMPNEDVAELRARDPRSLDLALASCVHLPEPDVDAALLSDALRAAGVAAEVIPWNAPGADFARARMTVVRSTWDYAEAPDAFAAWIERTANATDLWNPAPTLLWNLHKSYLLALRDAGIPTVPTELVRSGTQHASLAAIARALKAEVVVVKPAVSAASRGTLRVTRDDLGRGESHLSELSLRGDVLVQPYLRSVEQYGERAVVWINGELTHAVRKSPRFAGDPESVSSSAMPIAADEAEVARRAIAAAPGPLLYARVDLARDARGAPVVMELELLEPSLFLGQCPKALRRYVGAIVRRLAEGSRKPRGASSA
jgi:hypothetical protein